MYDRNAPKKRKRSSLRHVNHKVQKGSVRCISVGPLLAISKYRQQSVLSQKLFSGFVFPPGLIYFKYQQTYGQWELQGPEMEVLSHIRLYFWRYIPVQRPYIRYVPQIYLPEMAIDVNEESIYYFTMDEL